MPHQHDELARLANACHDEAAIGELVHLMEELKTVIETENEHLSRGLPASLLGIGQTKTLLSEEYAQLYAEIAGDTGIEIDDPALQEQLKKANAEIRALSRENTALLTKAVGATRRRVDAVMEAIRACEDLPDWHDDCTTPRHDN